MKVLTNVSSDYVDAAIDELVNLVGIKENIVIETVLEPLRRNKILECVQVIANHLDLPCAFSLSLDGKFESTSLVPCSSSNQSGAGITAQVHLPRDMPLYGTSKLQGFPIRVTISGDCTKNHETLVAILAHELSHVILSSLWHEKKINEIYTDLTPMILGFSEILKRGRKIAITRKTSPSTTTTTTTTYGYLSDTLFDFAYEKIHQILNEERRHHLELQEAVLCDIASCSRQIANWRKQILLLRQLVDQLDKNPKKRISKEDAPKIVQMHGLNYFDKIESGRISYEQKLREITDASINPIRVTRHYTRQEEICLQTQQKRLDLLSTDMSKDLKAIANDIEILRRYRGFFTKLKI